MNFSIGATTFTLSQNLTLNNTAKIQPTGNASNAIQLQINGNLFLASGASIDATGTGYLGGGGAGAGTGGGGGAFGGSGCQNGGGGGGAYGGAGATGNASPFAAGGTYNGSLTNPVSYGSAGGAGYICSGQSLGGNGGGIVSINVQGTLTLSGSVKANGNVGGTGSGNAGGGGGAGGTININAASVTGNGVLQANGGNAAGNPLGGGGSGGRVRLVITGSDSYTAANLNSIRAVGGTGSATAAPGPVYITTPSQRILKIHNMGTLPGADTTVDSAFSGIMFDTVTIADTDVAWVANSSINATNIVVAGTVSFSNSNWVFLNGLTDFQGVVNTNALLNVTGNATFRNAVSVASVVNINVVGDLTVNASIFSSAGRVTMNATGDISFPASASITEDGLGYIGSGGAGAGAGGGGFGGSGCQNGGGGGGGHGGVGSAGANFPNAAGGVVNDVAGNPVLFGSAGGAGYICSGQSLGGSGGGAVSITAQGNLSVFGPIKVNANNGGTGGGNAGGGGGAGGTINLYALGAISGNAVLQAKGGNGVGNPLGGNGGGGIIAVAARGANTFNYVNANVGPGSGGNGSGGSGVVFPEQPTLGGHQAGQVTNSFVVGDATHTLFNFRLTPAGSNSVVIDTVTFTLSSITRLTASNFLTAQMAVDGNGNGRYDVGETIVGGSGAVDITGANGTISFTQQIVRPPPALTEFVLFSTMTDMANLDAVTVSLPAASLAVSSAVATRGVVYAAVLGSVSNAVQTYADVERPGPITTLTGVPGAGINAVNLSWTAPADNTAPWHYPRGRLMTGSANAAYWKVKYTTSAADAAAGTLWLSTGAAQLVIATTTVNVGSVHSTTTSGLISAGATYYFRMWAEDAARSTSTLSIGATAQTPPSAPLDPVPVDPSAVLTTNNSITLGNWAPVLTSFTTGYWAEASVSPGMSPVFASSVVANYTTTSALFDTPALSPNTTYYMRVRPINPYGTTGPNSAVTSTATLTNAPAAAAVSFTAIQNNSMSVAWSRNSNPVDITTYTVVLSTDSPLTLAAAGNVFLTTAPAGTNPAATLGGLASNTTYYLFVRGVNHNSVGTSYVFMAATATLANTPAATGVPFPYIGITSMTVAWSPNGNPLNTSKYNVILSTGNSYPNSFSGNTILNSTTPVGNPPTATLTAPPLSPNVTYYLYVEAVNHNGAGSAAAAVGVAPTYAQVPAAAATSFLSVGKTSMTVAWSPNGNPLQVTSYQVFLATHTSGCLPGVYCVFFDTAPAGNPPAATFTNLVLLNTTYYLFVRAINHAGVYSDYHLGPTTATLAADPGSLGAAGYESRSGNVLRVSWSSGTPGGGFNPLTTLYRIDLSQQANFSVLTASSETYNQYGEFSGLTPSTTYYSRVQAVSHRGFRTSFTDLLSVFYKRLNIWNSGSNGNWHTGGNWEQGVPTVDDKVVINRAVTVTVAPSATAIDFYTLDVGTDAAATLVLNDVSSPCSGKSNCTGVGLSVGPGSVLDLRTIKPLAIQGDVTVKAGGSLIHAANAASQANAIILSASGNVTVEPGATLDASGRGYSGGAAQGLGSGTGGGAGTAVANKGGGGGAYGGDGGSGVGGAAGGTTNGPMTNPIDLGSGGGGGNTGAGGAGGGRIDIAAGGVLRVDGTLNADGGLGGVSAFDAGGGGSGGSVKLVAGTIAGSGLVRADGGAGQNAVGSSGGGSGGRILLENLSAPSSFTGTLRAIHGAGGGGSSTGGGAGVVVHKNPGEANYSLIIGTDTVPDSKTRLTDAVIFATVTVHSARLDVTAGGGVAISSLHVTGLAVIDANANAHSVVYAIVEPGAAGLTFNDDYTVVTLAVSGSTFTLASGVTLSNAAFSAVNAVLNFEANSVLAGDSVVIASATLAAGANSTMTAASGVSVSQKLTMATASRFYVAGNLSLGGAAVLTHLPNQAALTSAVDLRVTGNLSIPVGAQVLADGIGFQGGTGNATGKGPGGGVGSGGAAGAGGAGYGGAGGSGSAAAAGPANGNLVNPVNLGSGGGSGNGAAGGAGGGLVILDVSGDLTIDGTISANGATAGAGTGGGGGAGGAVNLAAGRVLGGGAIQVNGGSGGTAGAAGGGGGGGRVAIGASSRNDFSGLINYAPGTAGGGSANNGVEGTVASRLTLADYDVVGQAPNSFAAGGDLDPVDPPAYGLYRFKLSITSAPVTISRATFTLTGVSSLTASNFLGAFLVSDTNGNGTLEGAETHKLGGAGSVSITGDSGTIVFGTPFDVAATTNVILAVNLDGMIHGSALTVSLSSADLKGNLQGTARIGQRFGSATPAAHSYDDSQGPAAVTNLSALGLAAGGAIELSWTMPGDNGTRGRLENGRYYIQHTTQVVDAQSPVFWSTAAAQVLISTTGVPAGALQRYTVTNLIGPNRTHYFRIWTVDAKPNAAPLSSGATAATLALPSTPTGLAVTAVGSFDVSTSWNALPEASSFTVRYSTDVNLVDAVQSSASTIGSLNVGSLQFDATYYFQVRAHNPAGVSGFSSSVSTKTLHVPLPIAGIPPFAAVDVSSLAVSYASGPTVGGFIASGTSYYIQLASVPAFGSILASSATFNLSALFNGLSANTTYYLRGTAFLNSISTWSPSYQTLGTTVTAAEVPGAGGLSNAGSSSMTATWGAAGNPAGTQFRVEYSTRADFAPLWAGAPAVTTSTTRELAGLSGNQAFLVRVYAVNHQGRASPPASLGTLSTLVQVPGVPTGPYDVYPGSVTLRWDAGTNAAYTEYRIERGQDPTFVSNEEDTNWGVFQGSYSFSGLLRDTTYYFRVKARDLALAETPFTVLPATRTIVDTPTPRPSFTFISSLTARWDKGLNPNSAQYLAELARDSGYTLGYASSNWVANIVDYAFAGLTPNQAYFMRVRARNGAHIETSTVTLASALNTLSAPPGQPASAYSIGGNNIVVNWASGGNAAGTKYSAMRSSTSDFSVDTASSAYNDVLSFNFTGLQSDSTYYFRVRSRNEALIESDWTVLPSSATRAGPAPATDLTLSFADGTSTDSLQAQWQDNATDETSFQLERSTDGVSWVFSKSLPDQVGSSPYIYVNGPLNADPALLANVRYFYRVKAVNAVASSAYSNVASTFTRAAVPTADVPALSSVFAASVTASYAANGNSAGTQFVTVASTGTLPNSFSGNLSSRTASPSAVVSALAANTTYFLAVKAVNGFEVESAFVSLGATATLAQVPSAASPAFPAVNLTSMSVAWSPNANPLSVTTYTVALTTGSSYPNSFSGNVVLAATAPAGAPPTVELTGLGEANTTYYLFVRAVNHGGSPTPYAALGSTATLAMPPAAAGTTFAAVSQDSMTVSWAHNGNPAGVTRYNVVLSTGSSYPNQFSGNAVVAGTVPAGAAPTSTLQGLGELDTTYYLFVQAVNHNQVPGEFTALGSTATRAKGPGAPTTSAAGANALSVSWTAAGNPSSTLYVAEASTSAFPNADAGNLSTSVTALSGRIVGLAPDTVYKVRVRAVNKNGVPSESAAAADARTSVLGLSTPTVPAHGAYTRLDKPLFQWNGPSTTTVAEAGPGALYILEAADDPAFAALSVSVATPAASVAGAYLSTTTLAEGTTYHWRVRLRDFGGSQSAWSSTFAFVTDFTSPTLASFGHFNSSGALLGEAAAGDLLAGVTAQMAAQDLLSGLRHATGTFSAQLSTDAGAGWRTITATAPGAGPFVAVGGSEGSLSAQTLTVKDLVLANSTNAAVCGGAGACGATNQLVFLISDRAGNSVSAGPFAVVVDTRVGTPAAAALTADTSTQLTLQWTDLSIQEDDFHIALETAENPTAEFAVSATTDKPGTGSSMSKALAGLSPNTTYYARVRSHRHDLDGYSGYSAQLARLTRAAPPTAGALSAATTTTLRANWGANGNPAGTEFVLEFSSAPGFAPVWIGSPLVTTETVKTITGLSGNTLYYVRVSARNFEGVAASTVSLGSLQTALDAPTLADVPYDVFSTSVTVRWSTGTNAAHTQYRSQRSSFADFSLVDEDTNWAALDGAATFSDSIARNATYYFRVKARDLSLAELPAGAAWLNLASTQTLVDMPGPVSPEIFVSSIVARWSKGFNPAGAQYLAELARNDAFSVQYASSDWQTNINQSVFSGLGTNSVYHVRVRARNSMGRETPVLSLAAPSYTRAEQPGTPSQSYLRGGNNIVVNWDVLSNPLNTQFFAVRSSSADFSVDTASSGWTTAASFNFSGLAIRTTYFFRVKARNEDLLETPWTVLPSTDTLAGPVSPSALTASFADGSSTDRLSLSWQDNSLDENAFILERGTDGVTWSFVKSLPDQVSPGTGTYTYVNGPSNGDAALSPNARYYYRVKAINGIGDSSYTNTVVVFTRAEPPAAAAPVFTQVDAASMTAAFTANGNPAQTSYLLILSTGPQPNSFAGNLSSQTLSFSALFTGLDPNTTYYAGAQALNGDGVASGLSALASTATLALPAVNPAVTELGANALSVVWGGGGNPDGTVYVLEASTDSFPNAYSGNVSATAAATGARLSGVSPDTLYMLQVRARNHNGLLTTAVAAPDARTLAIPVSTPSAPADGSFVSVRKPGFAWTGPSTRTVAEAGPGAEYLFQLADNAAFSPIDIDVSTPAVVLDAEAAAHIGRYNSALTLSGDTTYYWRVRLRDFTGALSAWSQTAAFMTDFTTPTLTGFVSFDSTGGAMAQTQFNDLASGVTVQMTALDAGAAGLAASSASFTVSYSTTAGATWVVVSATQPGSGPYRTLSGAAGSAASETLLVRGLNLRQSTSALTGSGGTNLFMFTAADRAGNTASAGPFAVLIETAPAAAAMTSLSALSSGSVRAVAGAAPAFLFPVQDYRLELSTDPAFATLAALSPFQASADHSFSGLDEGKFYYGRVRTRNSRQQLSSPSAALSTQTYARVFISSEPVSFSAQQAVASVVLKIGALTLSPDSASFSTLRVRQTGTAADSDFQAAKLYADTDANGLFNPSADVELAAAAVSGGFADLQFAGNAQFIGNAQRSFFVVFVMHADAVVGNTVAAEIEGPGSFSFTSPFSAVGPFPIVSASTVTADGPNALLIEPSDLSPAFVEPGSSNVPLLRLRGITDTGGSVLSSLALRLSGSAPSTALSSLRLYRDANSNGTFELAGDTLLTSGGDAFLNGSSTIPLTASQELRTVRSHAPEFIFLTANVSASAPAGERFSVQVLSTASLALSTLLDTVSFSSVPFTTREIEIQTQNVVTVLTASQIPSDVTQGERYSVLKATLTVDKGLAQINRIQLNRTGSAVDADIAAVSIWQDPNPSVTGGVFNPGTNVLKGSSTFVSGSATINISTVSLTPTTTAVIFLVYELAQAANAGNTVGASLSNSSYFRVASPLTTVSGAFPLATSTATIRATVNTLLATPSNVAPGALTQGQTDIPFLKLQVRTDRNTIAWSGLTVTRLGTGADADVSRLNMYRDVNGDGLLQPATDQRVSSGLDSFGGGTAILAFNTVQSIGTAEAVYFLTADVSQSAGVGNTLGVRISTTANFNVTAPNLISTSAASFPIDAGPVAVNHYPNTVYITTASIVPAQGAESGLSDVGMVRLSMRTDVSDTSWSKLRVDRSGSVSDAGIANVKVYFDQNALGVFDRSALGQYVLVSSGTAVFGSVSPGVTEVSLSPVVELGPTPKSYFVVVDLSTSAVPGTTLIVRSVNFTYWTVDAPNTVSSTAAFESAPLSITEPASTMFIQTASSAPATVTQGDANVPFLRLSVWSDRFSAVWSRLTVSRTGTSSDADVTRVRLYADTNANGVLDLLGDAQLSTGAFSGGNAALSFAARTVTSSTQTLFLAYDLAATASADATLGARLAVPSVFDVASPDSVSPSGFPFDSAASQIRATRANILVTAQDRAPVTVLQGTTGQILLSLTLRTTEYTVVWSALSLSKLGTLADNLITKVRIYDDVNGDSAFTQGVDAELTSGNNTFSGGTANVLLNSVQTITTTQRKFLIAFDISEGAEAGRTFGVQVASAAAFTVSSPNAVHDDGFPLSSSLPSVAKIPATMRVAVDNLLPAGINQGVESAALRLTASSSRSSVDWTRLRLFRLGSLADAMITQLRVYRDMDGDRLLGGSDLLVGTGTFTAGTAQVDLSSAQTVGTSSITYLVALLIDLNATIGATAGVSLPDAGYITVGAPDLVDGSALPVQSAQAEILDAKTPSQPVVALDGLYTTSFDRLRFVWSSTVTLGSITDVQYCVGTTPGGQELLSFRSVPGLARDYTHRGLLLDNGRTYYVGVRAVSSFGLSSPVGVSAGILVDYSTPSTPAPLVLVGSESIIVQWAASTAGASGVMGYLIEYRNANSPLWLNMKTGLATVLSGAFTAAGGARLEAVGADQLFTAGPAALTGAPAGTFFVRTRSVSAAGLASDPSDPIRVLFGAVPTTGLAEVTNYPNPFDSRRGNTTIHFTLAVASEVTFTFYDLFGRRLRESSMAGAAGGNDHVWDGTDDGGRKVSMGVYICVIRAAGEKVIRKIGVIH
ncbi:MAG: hypothetical protein HYZ75_02340 [Elusimicrobia bacterium]|nr:hypothetical protein [Elusimicrobiota bacterium]